MRDYDVKRDERSRSFTLMLLPDAADGEVRRFVIPRWAVRLGIGAGLGLLLLAGGSLAWNLMMLRAARESPERVKVVVPETEASKRLTRRMGTLDDKIRELDHEIGRIREAERKMRSMTSVSDPDRDLAIGPVGNPGEGLRRSGPPQVSPNLREDLLGGPAEATRRLEHRVKAFTAEAGEVERSVKDLSLLLKDQRALLASIPSRQPAHGFITSEFGMRTDPFTGLQQLHAGMDFSAEIGSRVSAPADGKVIYARRRGAYGKSIEIEHVHGLTTRYAHLSEINVREGQKVKRGQAIGAIGNTGRSTGPHLHYEVRLNGVPQDPARFILE